MEKILFHFFFIHKKITFIMNPLDWSDAVKFSVYDQQTLKKVSLIGETGFIDDEYAHGDVLCIDRLNQRFDFFFFRM